MFQFNRDKILPIFLQRQEPVYHLARRAGVGEKTAWKAINGKRIGAPVVARIAEALDVDPMAFLVDDRSENVRAD